MEDLVILHFIEVKALKPFTYVSLTASLNRSSLKGQISNHFNTETQL